ncbi:MAG: winged helix-turn-helix domain-containing protein [Methanothrix sp.]|nr:winged helix-turn-helix domain-containing protein [Methanothrix sp.]
MQEKRSKYQIRAQILALFQEGASKTKIVYQINLNFHTVETHLDSNNSKRKDWYEN